MKFIPVLRVKDAATAGRWYERLGFEITGEHRFEPGFPCYMFLQNGDQELHLSEHTGDAPPRSLVYIREADVDALAAEFDVPIEEQPWGREIQLEDPDGNRLRALGVADG